MPDPWCPFAVRVPGENAGYRAGRIANLTTGLSHYTVGRNSLGLCGKYFQLLGARDGTLYQGAEVDAVNWGAGDPWNRCSVHYEVEYHPDYDDAVFTGPARDTARRFATWLKDEWGVPRNFYDGPRIPAWNGWINHGAVLQSGDWHYDKWPTEDAAIIFADQAPLRKRTPDMTVMWINFNGVIAYIVQGGVIVHQFTGAPNAYGIPQDASDFAANTNCGIVGMSGSEWQALLKRSEVAA